MRWLRSSACDSSSCVEVAFAASGAGGRVAAVRPDEWTKSSDSSTDPSCVEVQWATSSLCDANGGSCVEVGVWKKSTASDASGPWCVEVAGAESGDVLVRDTKDHGNGPVLRYTPDEWRAFVAGVKLGEFDLPGVA